MIYVQKKHVYVACSEQLRTLDMDMKLIQVSRL